MNRWKGFLVAGGTLLFSAQLTLAQVAPAKDDHSTFERLRSATLQSRSQPASEHPLDKPTTKTPAPQHPLDGPAAASFPSESPEPAEDPVHKVNYNEIRVRPTANLTGAADSAPRTAIHREERPVANPLSENVIHAEYSGQHGDKDTIVPVTGLSSDKQARGNVTITGAAEAPQADMHHPHVTVQWRKKGEIVVGEECEFDLVVTNTGDISAQEMEIDALFPATVRLTAAKPRPSSAEEHLTWKVESLAPGEEQILSVKLVPGRRGDLELSSRVRFTGAVKNSFVVAEPMLQIDVAGPQEVLIGEPASHTIKLSNPGTGTARQVTLEALIPSGLKHPRGERLMLEVGTLEPGESREVRLSLAAIGSGAQDIQIIATAANSLKQETTASTTVTAPSLALQLEGPGLRYKGRKGTYTLTVHNDGTAVSNNVRVRHEIPAGFEFVGADESGHYDAKTRVIDWYVGKLEPDAKQEMSIELMAAEFGKFTQRVSATSEHGTQTDATLDTRIEGTAALSLEILDLDDPVEVGAGNAYEIRVKNDGSIAAANVGIAFEMPAGVEFKQAEGPTEFQVEDQVVFFRSLPSLAPGKSATYQIQVKGTKAGNHRFRARLAADSIKEPLIFEELTKFYGE